jgi:hypothetical protein
MSPADFTSAPSGNARRAKFASYSIVLIVATIVVIGFLNFLASRLAVRLDVTAAGDQQLAPRTQNVLLSLKGRHEIVIAARLDQMDRRVLQRVKDTLRDLEHQSSLVSSRWIDTSTAGGREQYLQFVGALVARDRSRLDAQVDLVGKRLEGLKSFATFLGTDLSNTLLAIRDGLTGAEADRAQYRQFFDQTAAAARLSSQDLENAAKRAEASLKATIDTVSLPETHVAAKEIARVLAPTAAELDSLIKQVAGAQQIANLPGPLSQKIKSLAEELQARRDSIAMIADEMDRLPRLDVVRVVETLKSGSVCLVIGPREGALTAIDVDMLIPNAAAVAAANMSGVDIGRRGEDLFSVALSSLSDRPKPIVVIVHAEPRPVFEATPVVQQLARRLGMRGIDLVEWAAAISDQPNGLARLNPDGKRPVVYVSVAPNSAMGGDGKGQLTGPQRAEKLGKVLDELADQGKNILVGVFPSVLPTTGNPDPTIRVLERFGLVATSGRTLLRDIITARGRIVDSDFDLQPMPGDHPITKAIQGLPVLLSWPIDIANAGEPMKDVQTWPLVTMEPRKGVWSEAQWLKFWSTPADLRTQMADAPAFDRERDLERPDKRAGAAPDEADRPWTLGMAAELTKKNDETQRLIVIGANGWFIDRYAFRTSPVDGRIIVAYPGNLELFEASIAWLAHQDEMIAQSPTARLLPVVKPLNDGTLLTLRWVFVAGLPVLTLLFGVLHRWLRG